MRKVLESVRKGPTTSVKSLCTGAQNRAKWAGWRETGGFMADDVTSTSWLWALHADAHDFPSQVQLNGLVAARIFATHFGHLSVVAAWLSASTFGGARFSNFVAWIADPLSVKPSAQIAYAGAFHLQDAVNGDLGAGSTGLRVTSGAFQVWRTAGITSTEQLFAASIGFLVLSVVLLLAGWYHQHRAVPVTEWFNDIDALLVHHLTVVVGLGCLAWAGHLVHVSVPTDALLRLGVDPEGMVLGSRPFEVGVQSVVLDGAGGAIFSLNWAALNHLVTCLGGLNPATGSLWLTDVVHHHLAVGVLAVVSGHMYRTQFNVGTKMDSLLLAHRSAFMNSWHAQLAINLGVLGTGSILLAHLLLAFPAYAFLCMDWSTELSLFTHHAWIGGFFIVGAGAHAALFLVVDYRAGTLRGVERLLVHRHSIIAHLNWVSIFIGFHAFGMYIHNDTLSALGRREDLFDDAAIKFRPVVGLLAQSAVLNEGVFGGPGSFIGTRLTGTADLLVHHIHAFTIHVTALILVKGVLFARSSRLVSDKGALGFRFP